MIYVHVPFCRSFCTYCDFYSEIATRCGRAEDALRQETLMGKFADALAAEIQTRKDEITGVYAGGGVHTLFIGGGTPSVLPLDCFRRLLAALEQAGVPRDFAEFTVEVNPDDIVEKGSSYVEGLRSMGVNRISMGVQSFDDGVLKWMNRRHNAAQAVEAYRILEASGIENISIDLIFGLPQVSDRLWMETLDKALNISASGRPPRHISSYQLSVEPGSALASLVVKGLWKEAPEDLCRRQYSSLCELLSQAGYHHYEISNFAQPGFEAVHNSSYWKHIPYVGLGPGAHSFHYDAARSEILRQWNRENLDAYLAAAEDGTLEQFRDGESLDSDQFAMETVMLGLRTSQGLSEPLLRENCSRQAVERALADGNLVRQTDGTVRIPESLFFVSDRIITDLI